MRSGRVDGVLNARAFRIFRTLEPRPDFGLGARAFRIFRAQNSGVSFLNARALRAKYGHGPVVTDILSERAIRTPALSPECAHA